MSRASDWFGSEAFLLVWCDPRGKLRGSMAETNDGAKASANAPQTNSVVLPVMKTVPHGVAQIYRAFGKGSPIEPSGSVRTSVDIDRQDIGDFYSEDNLES